MDSTARFYQETTDMLIGIADQLNKEINRMQHEHQTQLNNMTLQLRMALHMNITLEDQMQELQQQSPHENIQQEEFFDVLS